MAGLADLPLGAFLDVVASTDPAPGAGSSSAVSGALAAALVEMTAGLGGDKQTAARAGELGQRALELADEDMSSYAPVLEALRLPGDDPERAERVQAALTGASHTPLEIAELSSELAELGAVVVRASNPAVRGDAIGAVLVAEAAAVTAAALVEVNLGGSEPADPQLDLVRAARERAQQARADALAELPRR
jgi:methenyltetrahydrofolate cyclohydrolase